MNNFLELLDTEFRLNIEVNGIESSVDILCDLKFDINDTVLVDGIEILPRYRHLAQDNDLIINEPFYTWYHRISGQGWLLKPQ